MGVMQWAAFLFTLCVGFVYVQTSFPGVASGDAGELAFVACSGGVAHPPGYPTYSMVAGMFVYVARKFGLPVMLANNMVGVVFGTLTGFLIFVGISAACGRDAGSSEADQERSAAAALLFSGLYCFGKLQWMYSLQSEVFSLNNAFASGLLVLYVYYLGKLERRAVPSIADGSADDKEGEGKEEKGEEKKGQACQSGDNDVAESRALLLSSFLCGFSLTNQHTMILFVIPAAAIVVFQSRRLIAASPSIIFACIGTFLGGLTPYAYLPVASLRREVGSWGKTHTLSGFFVHLLRQEYGTFQLFSGKDGIKSPLQRLNVGLSMYANHLNESTYYIGLPLLLIGLLSIRKNAMAFAAAVLLIFYTLVFHLLANLNLGNQLYLGVHARFWMQPNVVAYLLMALGLARCMRWFQLMFLHVRPLPLVILLLGLHTSSIYREMDESENLIVHDYGRAFLDHLPRNAKLLVVGDTRTNSIRSTQLCFGHRTDVQVVNLSMLTYEWFIPNQRHHFPDFVFPGALYHPKRPNGFNMKQFLDANVKLTGLTKDRMFIAGGWYAEDASYKGHYFKMPYGLPEEVVPSDKYQHFNISDLAAWSATVASRIKEADSMRRSHFKRRIPEDRWESHVLRTLGVAHHERAHFLLLYGQQRKSLEAIELAIQGFNDLNRNYQPPFRSYFIKNLGIAWQEVFKMDPTNSTAYANMIHHYQRYTEAGKPPDDPKFSDVVMLLENEKKRLESLKQKKKE